jgi:hypothetical protein
MHQALADASRHRLNAQYSTLGRRSIASILHRSGESRLRRKTRWRAAIQAQNNSDRGPASWSPFRPPGRRRPRLTLTICQLLGCTRNASIPSDAFLLRASQSGRPILIGSCLNQIAVSDRGRVDEAVAPIPAGRTLRVTFHIPISGFRVADSRHCRVNRRPQWMRVCDALWARSNGLAFTA